MRADDGTLSEEFFSATQITNTLTSFINRSLCISFDRVVEKISKIEEAAGIKLPNSEDAEISKVEGSHNSILHCIVSASVSVPVLNLFSK